MSPNVVRRFTKSVLIALSIICSQACVLSQVNIHCLEVKFNDKYYPNSTIIRNAIETEIIRVNRNVVLSERSDLADVESFIQSDNNLRVDYDTDSVNIDRKLKEMDFLIKPRLSKFSFNQFYSLQIDVISLRNGDFLDKIILPTIELSEDQITRSTVLEPIFNKAFINYSFTSEYGFIHNSKLRQFKIEIQEKVNTIDSLNLKLLEIEQRAEQYEKLKRSVPNYNAKLILIDSMLHVAFEFNNEVPINVRVINSSSTYNLDKSNELPLFGHLPLEDYDIFPPQVSGVNFTSFKYDSFGGRDREYLKRLGKIRVIMDLKIVSKYAAEIQSPELSPVFIQLDYILDWNNQEMMKFKE